ncbi:hypothetical protein B0X41_03595 [Helicobacter pylori]|uniref:Uncharacterized protein n=1 Tax=Helicobacter pylori TaxID=210 RepID=A0AB36KDL8_HELPX|nr:hypothetical protein B0X41_03595 [Helicobacter pylori]
MDFCIYFNKTWCEFSLCLNPHSFKWGKILSLPPNPQRMLFKRLSAWLNQSLFRLQKILKHFLYFIIINSKREQREEILNNV